jgi:hypothetical protein
MYYVGSIIYTAFDGIVFSPLAPEPTFNKDCNRFD